MFVTVQYVFGAKSWNWNWYSVTASGAMNKPGDRNVSRKLLLQDTS